MQFYIHWPGEQLRLPPDMLETVQLIPYGNQKGKKQQYSPDYGDPLLLQALDYFIEDFAARYDGDKRIGYVQQGLLGFYTNWLLWSA